MIQRCGMADAARALIDSAPESNPPGCTAAPHVQPPTRASTARVALSTAVRGRPVGSSGASGLVGGPPVGPAACGGGVLVGSGMRTTLGRVPARAAGDQHARRGGAADRHGRRGRATRHPDSFTRTG